MVVSTQLATIYVIICKKNVIYLPTNCHCGGVTLLFNYTYTSAPVSTHLYIDRGAHQTFSTWCRMAENEWDVELGWNSWEEARKWLSTLASGEESLKLCVPPRQIEG